MYIPPPSGTLGNKQFIEIGDQFGLVLRCLFGIKFFLPFKADSQIYFARFFPSFRNSASLINFFRISNLSSLSKASPGDLLSLLVSSETVSFFPNKHSEYQPPLLRSGRTDSWRIDSRANLYSCVLVASLVRKRS